MFGQWMRAYGHEIWHYHRTSPGDHIGNRGVGMYKNWIYFETPDAHLVCLDAKDGKLRWDVELGGRKAGLLRDNGAVGDRDHIIVGSFGRRNRRAGVSRIG